MTQNFFTSRLGKGVIRIAPDGRKTTITIESYAMAEYLHSLQEHGYTFKEPVVIHNRLQECEACSS